jgi:hypothetical protein
MAQATNYPLPPLFLTEIIQKAKSDHTHQCESHCAEDDFGRELCESSRLDNQGLLDVPVIVKIEAGYGRHIHDDPEDVNGCNYQDYEVQDKASGRWIVERRKKWAGCMNHCDDSDWIVTLQYHRSGWQAVYGIKRAGDVQDVQLWMD